MKLSISKQNYQKILVLALGLAAAGFVGGTAYYYMPGDSAAPETRQVFDPQWQSCTAGDTCIAVLGPCGTWETVNRKYQSEGTAYYDQMIRVVDESGDFFCTQMPDFGPAPPAVCRFGQCALAR